MKSFIACLQYHALTCLLFSATLFFSVSVAADSRFQALSQLNLTPAQQSQINQIQATQESQIGSLQKELKANQAKLNSLLQNDASSDAEVAAQRKKIDNIQSSLSSLKVKSWIQVKQILTPEQTEKLNKLQLNSF